MSLRLLWLGLTLLGALQTQAQRPTVAQESTLTQEPIPTLIPAPALSSIPLKPDFRNDKFQGKWYVVGVAGNAITKEKDPSLMYTTTYELQDDGSYNVTSTRFRDENCTHWTRTFVPTSQPGQFSLGNIDKYSHLSSYTVRVTATDYNCFAIVYFKKVSKNQEYFKTTLYKRIKKLTHGLKKHFIQFAKSLGLPDNHITFLVPTDRCIDDA